MQTRFPLSVKPFAVLADETGLSEEEVIERVKRLKEARVVRQISAIFDSRALGYKSSLAAFRVDPSSVDEAAQVVSRHPGVSHNYLRNHSYNLWFTITVGPGRNLEQEVEQLAEAAGAESARLFPTLRLFKIGVAFDMFGEGASSSDAADIGTRKASSSQMLDDEDIKFVKELQKDLDVIPRPFEPMARRLGVEEEEVIERAREFIQQGMMRRYAAVLRHREAGFTANAMGAWNVPEERVEEVGKIMAAHSSVSHCYQRPTYPDWPYSVFTMIHGKTVEEVEETARQLSRDTGITDYVLLYSSKEYKKERVRYFQDE